MLSSHRSSIGSNFYVSDPDYFDPLLADLAFAQQSTIRSSISHRGCETSSSEFHISNGHCW